MGGGTGNAIVTDLNRSTLTIEERLNEILKEKEMIKLDVGLVTYENQYGFDEKSYFINLIGLGLAIDANKTADKLRRCCSFMGEIRYLIGILWNICKNHTYEIEIMKDNEGVYHRYDINCVFIQNTIHGGSRLKLAPEASINDGYLDLVFNVKKNRMGMFELLKKVGKDGTHIEDDDVKYYKFRNLKLRSPEKMDLNIDGENYGSTNIEVELHNKQIYLR